MCRRLNSPTPGTGKIRIIYGTGDFVASNRVPSANLEIQPVSDRRMQRHVGLFDSEVTRACLGAVAEERLGPVHVCIWPEPQLGLVTSAPGICRIHWFLQGNIDDVQVKPVRLACSAETVRGGEIIPRAQV